MSKDYNLRIYAEVGCEGLDLLVPSNTDFDAKFIAWDIEGRHFLRVNGWMCDIRVLNRDTTTPHNEASS